MHTTNYVDTFIAVADDCPVDRGTMPPETTSPTVAARTYRMISEHPYAYTSDDVIFSVWADRNGIPEDDRPAARVEFFSKGQPCLRSSPLGKRYGWGVHCDSRGHVALLGLESDAYRALVTGQAMSDSGRPVTVKKAMRSSRG